MVEPGDLPVARYILFRLLLGLGLFALAFFELRTTPGTLEQSRLAFDVGAVAFTLMGISAAVVGRFGTTVWFRWLQLVLDAIVAMVLVWWTGGPQSPFIVLFFMNIVASVWLVDPWGAMAIAALDALLFALSVVGDAGSLTEMGWNLFSTSFYADFVLRVFALFLVGLLSAQLAGNLRRARRALARQVERVHALQERHDMVLDQVRTGVLITDVDGIVRKENSNVAKLLGDVVGRPLGEVLDVRGDRWEQHYERDGDQRVLVCSRSTLVGGGQVAVVEDVTSLRELEQRIAREERMAAVGRLAAGLAHEIRNPLASLSGSVQLLREGASDPLHDIVLREVERLDRLVEDFLDIARPLRLDRTDTDVSRLFDEVITAFANDPRYTDRRLVRRVSRMPTVRVDAARLRQVLWNLLLNAAQHTRERGTIRVRAEVESNGRTLVLEVSDDGVGIPADALPHIFDPFFTRRSGGTGLGLAMVERIVRAHGGTVEAASLPGQGASFTVRLPVAPPAATGAESDRSRQGSESIAGNAGREARGRAG